MAEISAAMVMKLRQQTGAAMMLCKEALKETDGDFEAATVYIRKKLGNKLSGATPISSKRIITSPVVLSPMATCFFPRSSFKWRRIAVRRTCKARRFSPNPRACCGETKRRGSACQTIIRAERCLLLKPCDARAPALGSLALFDDGQTTRAMEWSKRSLELYPEDMSTLIQAACLHSRMGVKEEALRLLERVFSHGWGKRDWIEHDPDYDILCDDPRFQTLVHD